MLSVEKTSEGFCGEIRIVCANELYKKTMGPAYYDGMPYYELVPKDVKFEDFCFRAAHMGQLMHAYVETKALGCWTDQLMIPLGKDESDQSNLGYCQFLFEFTETADPSRMASVSIDTATAAIKASITLLGTEDFKDSVKDVLTDILDYSDALSCRIMLIDHEQREAIVFCEKNRNDQGPDESLGDGSIAYEVVNSWEGMIGESNAVIVKDEKEMEALEKRNPEWVKTMRHYRVESLVLIPLRRGKKILGYLYVVNFDVSKVVQVKELIELVSFFLGSEISNYLLMNQLEALSKTDGLTGLLNRNAMIRCRERIPLAAEGTAFGIVNVDLNGLKVINDTGGHEEGDRAIIKTAELLRGCFREDDLYRVGGDEFIAIVRGIAKERFGERVDKLRIAASECDDVSISIGSIWSSCLRTNEDVDEAFRVADELMYADKNAYYEAHPEFRR